MCQIKGKCQFGNKENSNMQANLYRLSEEWKEIDTIILYGAGIVFKICQNLFEKVNIKISFIIDRDVNKI